MNRRQEKMFIHTNLHQQSHFYGCIEIWSFITDCWDNDMIFPLRTRFPVVRSTWNLHHVIFAQITSQNRQIAQIARSRSCGRSLENHGNVVLGDKIAGAVLLWTMIGWKWLAETVKNVTELVYPNFHQIPPTQFPHIFIQKTVISPYWGRDCCSTGIWNPIEI